MVESRLQCRCPCTCDHKGECQWCLLDDKQTKVTKLQVAAQVVAASSLSKPAFKCKHLPEPGALCHQCYAHIKARGYEVGFVAGYDEGLAVRR